MSFRRAFATLCLTAGLLASASGDETTAHAQAQAPPLGGNAAENEAYHLLKENKLLTARTKADQILEKDPDSILGNYVLGCVLREAEGDLARAMYRLGRARELFEQRYGGNPPPTSPWAFHRELLFETQVLAGEMEEYEYQLQIIDFHDALYDPKLVAEHAWPLLRLGKFDEARKIARTASAASDRGQQSLGRNALCAIEGEARQRKPYFDACVDALENAKKSIKAAQAQPPAPNQPAGTKELPSTRDAIPVVHQYNAALAAYSVLRFEEVERLAKEGTGGRPLTIANPWRILTRLYTDGGRAAEAVQAAREMQSWRAHQLANLRDQDRAETDAVLASLLLVAGETESAERLIQRAIERPDRRGLVSSKPDQALGAHALLRRAIAKTRSEQLSERASWSGTKDRSKKATSALATRIASWPEDERIVSILSDGSRLDSTFRMFLSGGIEPVPSWLVSDLVDIVGPGVIAVVLEKVRSEEKGFDPVLPYYDAIEAEVAFRRGDEKEAIDLARKAIAKLPKSEGILSARVAAIGAEAARKSGDHAAAMALFEQSLQKDAGAVRRLGFSIPARVTGSGDASVSRAVTLLGRSPRLRDDNAGFVVAVEKGGGVLRACLRTATGATLTCSTAAPIAKEAPDDWAARLVEGFHRDAFALRVGLTTRDLNSLDGSTTAASQNQREQMNGVLKGLADDAK